MSTVFLITVGIQIISILFLSLNIVHFYDFSSKFHLKKMSDMGRFKGIQLYQIMIVYVLVVLGYLVGSMSLMALLSSV